MAIIKTKSNYITTQLNESKNNPKRFWRSMREVLPQRNTSIIKRLIDTENNSKIEKDRLPSFINTLFANIGHHLAQPLLMKHPLSAQPVRVDGNFDLFSNPFTPEEVNQLTHKIDVTKSSGLSNINVTVLRDALTALQNKFLKILNISAKFSKFPSAWKFGTIIPLPKKANSENVTDLRPISLLPVPGKILERLVCTRLNNYLEKHAHLTQAQHGYRKGRSTLTSITKFLNDVYSNANEKLPTHAVFLDLRKAFNTVSHSHLIDKLSSLDLNIHMLNWFSCPVQSISMYTTRGNCF